MTLAQETADAMNARLTARLRATDPLLPDAATVTELAQPSAPQGCGAEFTAAGPDGRLVALIAGWRAHLAEVPGTGDEDSAAIITWPSRDIGGITTLLGHGLSPLAVVAARLTRSGQPGPVGDVASPPGAQVRRARPDDLGTLARLGLELVRYDAHFLPVIERPDTLDGLRLELTGLLEGADPWAWLAERAGQPVGMLVAERPEHAAWIAPMVAQSPAAYLFLMYVLPQERGSGIGAALAGHLHQAIARAGVAVTLLHYAQFNPLSAPFWSQQGYRPLWTSWEAWPASALR